MNKIANCKNGKTKLVSVNKCVKTLDSARKETKDKIVKLYFKYFFNLKQ